MRLFREQKAESARPDAVDPHHVLQGPAPPWLASVVFGPQTAMAKTSEDSASEGERCGGAQEPSKDGRVLLHNPHLKHMGSDHLYHLALGTATHDLKEMFGDLKFICMGGTPTRMQQFAHFAKQFLGVKLPTGADLYDISHYSYRYSMYKIGPVLSVSHILGELVRRPTVIDNKLANDIVAVGRKAMPELNIVTGKTMCTNDFYEGTPYKMHCEL
ncbi:uridine phosphorylase, putative [Ixodes scapularis]|uniref:Uridine phosphorylase, putative n=1 Tax=Ixodes scapularis TaxID=6945 RepID=B7P767_IXOSC|nr:uridine phosphorylase, putative [Ixodes scapularis]|eukprot:XP_002409632.1 uridine phosphorylase, putative [Ixodes scapularis]